MARTEEQIQINTIAIQTLIDNAQKINQLTQVTSFDDADVFLVQRNAAGDSFYATWLQIKNAIGGGSMEFLDLTDVPSNYSCQVGKNVKVKATGDGLEFTPDYMDFACSDETSDLTVDIVFTMICNRAYTKVSAIEFSVTTAPTGANLEFDVRKNGTTIYTTPPIIDAGEKLTYTASVSQIIGGLNVDFAIGDELQVRVTQVGSTVAGKGLKATMIYNNQICV